MSNSFDINSCIKIGWWLLEHRYKYYVHDDPSIPDLDYDFIEKAYMKRCSALKIRPSGNINRAGFDIAAPSVEIVRHEHLSAAISLADAYKIIKKW